jgi:homoserine kinase
MGPGFDCLAMALDVWNTIHVELDADGVVVNGEGNGELPTNEANLVYRSFLVAFEKSGRPRPRAAITCDNRIPLARGLGSSAAAAVAGLVAGNELCGRPLDQTQILELAAEVEGHPDNVSAAVFGGCQIVVENDGGLTTSEVPIADQLRAVVFVPDDRMPTDEARSVLTKRVERSDAIYNMGRVALLVAALTTGDASHLATATQDRLHQPARQEIYPAMKNIFRAALNAGALGVFLSGAGSSVLALAQGREATIGYEMAEAASKSGVGGSFIVTEPTTAGAHVV